MDDLTHPVEPGSEPFGSKQEAVHVPVRDPETGLEERTPINIDLGVTPGCFDVDVHPPVAGVVDNQRVVAAMPDDYGPCGGDTVEHLAVDFTVPNRMMAPCEQRRFWIEFSVELDQPIEEFDPAADRADLTPWQVPFDDSGELHGEEKCSHRRV